MVIYNYSPDNRLDTIILEDEVVGRAYLLAKDAHSKQKRRYSSTPYITHPLKVADILLQDKKGTTSAKLAAALLHDVVEDTPITDMEIQAKFGKEVWELVYSLTDEGHSLEHRTKTILRMQTYPNALLIKMADRLANLEEISDFTQTYRYKPDVIASTELILGVAKGAGLDDSTTYRRLNQLAADLYCNKV